MFQEMFGFCFSATSVFKNIDLFDKQYYNIFQFSVMVKQNVKHLLHQTRAFEKLVLSKYWFKNTKNKRNKSLYLKTAFVNILLYFFSVFYFCY